MEICILSGCDHVRFNSFVNHRLFADANGVDYIFDLTLTPKGERGHLNKLRSIRDRLRRYDAVFWIDDDAYFTDFSWNLERYFSAHAAPLVVCEGPPSPGGASWISSGQFFLRGSETAFAFLDAALKIDLEQLRSRWDVARMGRFTHGDQDCMVDLMLNDPRFADFFARLPYQEFNARPAQFTSRLTEHRLVHFVGGRSKTSDMRRFVSRMGCNEFIVPEEALAAVETFRYHTLEPRRPIGFRAIARGRRFVPKAWRAVRRLAGAQP